MPIGAGSALGWGYLWEMGTLTGESFAEPATGFRRCSTRSTQVPVKIRPGVYWTTARIFTVDDVIYTITSCFKYRDH